MFNIYAKYQRNEKRAQDGAPMVLGKNDDGNDVIIFVKRLHPSNVAFKNYVEAAQKQHQREVDSKIKSVRDEISTKITSDAVEHTCIVGWTENMQDAQGNLISFTPENVARIRNDLPELFDAIIIFGADDANYVGTFDESETVKNLPSA